MGSVMTCKLNPCCGDRRNCDPPKQYRALDEEDWNTIPYYLKKELGLGKEVSDK